MGSCYAAAQYWKTQFFMSNSFWVVLIRFHLHCGTSGLIWCFCKVNEKICPVPPASVFQVGKSFCFNYYPFTCSLSWRGLQRLPFILACHWQTSFDYRSAERWKGEVGANRKYTQSSCNSTRTLFFSHTHFNSLFLSVSFSYLLN